MFYELILNSSVFIFLLQILLSQFSLARVCVYVWICVCVCVNAHAGRPGVCARARVCVHRRQIRSYYRIIGTMYVTAAALASAARAPRVM